MDMGLRKRTWVETFSAPAWRHTMALIILLALLAGFVLDGWGLIHEHWNSRRTDQSAYLRLGLRIRQGVALTDGNRHPLYPAILALFARHEWFYFTAAKLLNLVIACLTLLVVYWAVRRISGIHTALLTVALLRYNPSYLDSASRAVAEPLLVLIVFVTWLTMWKRSGSVRRWFLAGLGAGLAYLAKGTGQIIPIVFILAMLLIYRLEGLRQRALWLFMAGYVLVACGLWVYNAVNYGNPFYNFSTTHAMWLDTWEDRYVADPSQLPTMITYLQTHTPGQIMQRLSEGLILVLRPIADAWFPRRDIVIALYEMVTLAALVLWVSSTPQERRAMAHRSYCERTVACFRVHREGVVFTAVLLVIWYLFFAWYIPVSKASRFFLPLAPLVQIGIASALIWGVRIVLDWLPWPRGKVRVASVNLCYLSLAVLMVLATSVGAFSCFRAGELTDPFYLDRERNTGDDAVLEWLLSKEDDRPIRLLLGPGRGLPTWRYDETIDRKTVPLNLKTWDEVAAFTNQYRLSWAIVDSETVIRRPHLFADYFSLEGKGLILRQPPPGWTLAREFDTSGHRWYIFEIAEE